MPHDDILVDAGGLNFCDPIRMPNRSEMPVSIFGYASAGTVSNASTLNVSKIVTTQVPQPIQ